MKVLSHDNLVELDTKELMTEFKKTVNKLTEAESIVMEKLCEYLDSYPLGFFCEKTEEELNKHFKAEGEYVVTPKIRLAMAIMQALIAQTRNKSEQMEDLPEE